MANWNDLSLALKQRIIEKLEFRTRFRFRHVAKSTQLAVDSLNLRIPRVNFKAHARNRINLTIYLAIGSVIDLEFGSDVNNVTELKISTSWTTKKRNKKSKTRRIPCRNPFFLAVTTLKSIVQTPKTVLGTLEFAAILDVDEFRTIDSILKDGPKIRTRILKTDSFNDAAIGCHVARTDISEIHILMKDSKGTVPVVYTRKMRYFTRKALPRQPQITGFYGFYSTEETVKKEMVELWNDEANQLGLRVERSSDGDEWIRKNGELVLCRRKTACGVMIRTQTYKFYPEESSMCELRWTCSKCADPFDRWYQLNVAKETNGWELDAKMLKVQVLPVINNVCPINGYFKMAEQSFIDWESACKKDKKSSNFSAKTENFRKIVISIATLMALFLALYVYW
ncbi:unnamed protein product [Caenorhabditis sp. 36 PRJEB53466]|nr:unnamed protein product [Caenorhabditis sp. 36 PRJEB53466]